MTKFDFSPRLHSSSVIDERSNRNHQQQPDQLNIDLYLIGPTGLYAD